jgi:hypothetical protein
VWRNHPQWLALVEGSRLAVQLIASLVVRRGGRLPFSPASCGKEQQQWPSPATSLSHHRGIMLEGITAPALAIVVGVSSLLPHTRTIDSSPSPR